MAKKKEKESEQEIPVTKEQENPSEAAEEREEERAEKERILALEQDLKEKDQKLAETEDRLLRTLAEYDNFKKRTVKEKEALYFAAKSDVIKKLLPVFDNFDRAQTYSDGSEYAKGVDMIIRQFRDITEAMEIREIAKVGDPFDPNFHEAVFREEKEGVEENTVTEVLQKGYAIGDQVIRHAMVKVSV